MSVGNRKETLQLRLPVATKARVRAAAAEDGVNMTHVMETALLDWLARRDLQVAAKWPPLSPVAASLAA
jgi:hypothetical protein